MQRHKNMGFTLIEVMVALVIVALSLTAVAASMNQMIDAAISMRNRTYASWIAQNRIAELRLAPTMPDVGASNGEVEYANVDWSWRAVISETGVDDLLRVDVSVSFAGSEETVRTVTGFIGPPGAAGEANRVWNRSRSGNPASNPEPDAEAGSDS
jgi:general secretion pathway protein I